MFKKLLKYDLKAIARLWWIGAVISVAAAVAGALLFRFAISVLDGGTDSVFLQLLSILALIVGLLSVFAVLLSYVFTIILIFTRFYKHFFTDEGYLTFTLPVKRSTLFLSKTVSAVIWYCAHFCVILISLLLFAVLVTPLQEGEVFLSFYVLEAIGALFTLLWKLIGAWLIVYILEVLLILFVCTLFTISLIHFCITFSAVIAKKAKVILAILMFYLLSGAFSTVSQFSLTIFGGLMLEGMTILTQNASPDRMCGIYALLLMVMVGIMSVLGAALYSATQYMLDRKLNLA